MARNLFRFDQDDADKYGKQGAILLDYMRSKIQLNEGKADCLIHGKIWVKLDIDVLFQCFYMEFNWREKLAETLFDLITQSAILAVAFTHEDGKQNLVYTLHDAAPARLAVQA